MLKRQATGPKTARKKKKGNATFSTTSLDDDADTEDVRIWNVSASKNTGRVNATRTTLKHLYQPPNEIPSVDEGSWVDETAADVSDAGILADSESPPGLSTKNVQSENARGFSRKMIV